MNNTLESYNDLQFPKCSHPHYVIYFSQQSSEDGILTITNTLSSSSLLYRQGDKGKDK